MSKITTLLKINIKHYDEESVFIPDDYYNILYSLSDNKYFRKKSWYKSEEETFNEVLTTLEQDLYLVNKQFISLNIINSMSTSDADDEYELDSDIKHLIPLIWEDIKDSFYSFDRYGVLERTLLVAIDEHWSTSWEGESDCYYEYLGIIDYKSDITSLLTEKSRRNKKQRDIDLENSYNYY